MLDFTTYESSSVLVIALESRDGAHTDRQAAVREALYRIIEAHQGAGVAIDMGAIQFLSSSEIGFLIGLKRRIEALHSKVALYQVNPYILDTFRTMHLNRFFSIAGSFAEAVRSLGTVVS